MDNDDISIGRILTRREAITLLGATGAAAFLSACLPRGFSSPTAEDGANGAGLEEQNTQVVEGCVVRPEMTEGPLFVDNDLNRSDIREDPSNGIVVDGTLLELTFNVSELAAAACVPLAGVQVDIWQCDAAGIYSDTDQLGMDTAGQKFLRGYQVSDASGVVTFKTIYPGWYVQRAVHIHFKMRTENGYEFTSQLFFEDDFTEDVFKAEPYAQRGSPAILNADDGIYNSGGNMMMLNPQPTADGYTASFNIALDMA
ncbi:MAG: twin-arginine translocation pathway signal protein [Chloroflexota bacterium]